MTRITVGKRVPFEILVTIRFKRIIIPGTDRTIRILTKNPISNTTRMTSIGLTQIVAITVVVAAAGGILITDAVTVRIITVGLTIIGRGVNFGSVVSI